ncbi:Ribonuclease R [compost metagenome]
MRDRVGETFPGVISAVTGFGIFVELIDIYVEGLVHVTALPGDYYHFDPIHHRLSGERSGRSFRLGDEVEVVVARVDLDERKIDFELSENVLTAPVGRKNRGADKPLPGKGKTKAAGPKAGKGRSRGAKGAARHAQQGTSTLQQEPKAAVAPRRQRAGKVQALPAVPPEMLAQAEEMLGNTDVNKSRAVKQALLNEARQGAKSSKGKRPAQNALDKPARDAAAGATAKPPKKKAKAAKAKVASKPTKHRKGPPKPKAPGSKVKK